MHQIRFRLGKGKRGREGGEGRKGRGKGRRGRIRIVAIVYRPNRGERLTPMDIGLSEYIHLA